MMINWAGVTSVFLLALIKFMFAPFAGVPIGLHYYETYFAAVSGGIISSAFFYFGSDFLMELIQKKRLQKQAELIKNGVAIKTKKRITKTNRFIINLKRRFGKLGICFWAPFFLSVPIGSFIVAKFYGHEKNTFLLVVLGMLLNATITTFLAYVIFK
jgi:hypothetical protein